ncbi:hypothetical protein JKF63_03323 [Porcisia hertigi]|uniref:Uncharacterized protein n=1 Tax=Porcisia hertigi TaxID=2761500 RepID=A0A836HYF1_9TRYP|nr:hypothetical protein JKF63_03323 [Porcisia hertigi]
MEEWINNSLKAKYIRRVDPCSVESGIFCEAFTSPWYDDGVVFDWTALHQRLVRPISHPSKVIKGVTELQRFGVDALKATCAEGDRKCFLTVVELKEPWTIQPLSEQAQNLSVFDVLLDAMSGSPPTLVHPTSTGSSPAPPSQSARQLYAFLRGPPGQRAVRDDMARVLSSVERQFRERGVQVVSFLSSFVLFGSDFEDMLHSTAAVFRALTEVGFSIDDHGSCLGPRIVTPLSVDAEDWWTTLPLQQVQSEEDVASLMVALFYQWLQDAYIWGCTAPIRLFPDLTTAIEDAKATRAVRSVRLLERFVRGLVLPRAHAVGLDVLYSSLPEEGGSLFDLAAASLEQKPPRTGLQQWSVGELRVLLAQVGAYAHIPSEYLAESVHTAQVDSVSY